MTSGGATSSGGHAASSGGGITIPDDARAACFDTKNIPSCTPALQNGLEWRGRVLADVSSLGYPEARFRDLGGRAALLERADGTWAVIAADLGPDGIQVYDIDTSQSVPDLRMRSAYAEEGPLTKDELWVVALGCGSTGCQLFGTARRDDTVLRPIADLELPAGADVRKLSGMGHPYAMCAYGQGLFCVENEQWTSVLAPAQVGEIVAADPPFAAATADGRLLTSAAVGWDERPSPIGTAISVRVGGRGMVSVLDTAGNWLIASITNESQASCVQSPPLLAAIPNYLAVALDGTGYAQPDIGSAWCQLWQAGPSDLVQVDEARCSLSQNVFAISETKFYSLLGEPDCIID